MNDWTKQIIILHLKYNNIRFHDKHHQQIQCKKCIDFQGNKKLIQIDDKINTLISTIRKPIDFKNKNQ